MNDETIRTFTLTPPDEDREFEEICRWLIQVMDREDKSLPFIASLFVHCLKYDGLTDRQASGLEKVFIRVKRSFENNLLNIQGCFSPSSQDGDGKLLSFADRKRAK